MQLQKNENLATVMNVLFSLSNLYESFLTLLPLSNHALITLLFNLALRNLYINPFTSSSAIPPFQVSSPAKIQKSNINPLVKQIVMITSSASSRVNSFFFTVLSWFLKLNSAAFFCSFANLLSYFDTFFRVGLMLIKTEIRASSLWECRNNLQFATQVVHLGAELLDLQNLNWSKVVKNGQKNAHTASKQYIKRWHRFVGGNRKLLIVDNSVGSRAAKTEDSRDASIYNRGADFQLQQSGLTLFARRK